MKELASPALAIVGVLFGALLQHLLSRRTESQKSYDKLRAESYVDLLRGIAGVAMAQRFQDRAAEMSASSLMLDAKIRIAVYGDGSVVRDVGNFFGKHGDLSPIEGRRAPVSLICKMRYSISKELADSYRTAVGEILFGPLPEE